MIDKLRFAFKFRLFGGNLLSLCGESKQRRIKGGKETVRAVSLPPLNPSYLSTDRGSPPHGKRAVSYVIECVKPVPAQLGQLKFEPPTAL